MGGHRLSCDREVELTRNRRLTYLLLSGAVQMCPGYRGRRRWEG